MNANPFFATAVSGAAANISATPARSVVAFEVTNPNANAVYLQLFNVPAASVTVGTTTPRSSLMVPGGTANNPGGRDGFPAVELEFGGTGLSYAITTTPTGATTVTGTSLNVFWR
jgi:hypothetical protein